MFTLKKDEILYNCLWDEYMAQKYINNIFFDEKEKASMFEIKFKINAEFKPTSGKLLANVFTKI